MADLKNRNEQKRGEDKEAEKEKLEEKPSIWVFLVK